MHVAIVDYGSGNLRSAAKAFERVMPEGKNVTVTSEPSALAGASHIVLPGVGAFADCINGLKTLPGMLRTLEKEVISKRKPFLGICVGMQMLFEKGFEHGEHKGLGWLKGEVAKINSRGHAAPDSAPQNLPCGVVASAPPRTHAKSLQLVNGNLQLKIPHMGWNDLTLTSSGHPLLAGIHIGDHAYFVHSYYAVCGEPDNVLATVDYGSPITAIVAKGNIMGTQFHPEKSQQMGLRLLGNFLRMEP